MNGFANISSELRKLRSLPTPRWGVISCAVSLAIAVAVSIFVGTGPDDAAIGLGTGLPTAVLALVLGAWIVGLEYGQGTMRRTLSADPRRLRLVAAKYIATSTVVLGVTVLSHLLAWGLFPLLSDDGGASSTTLADWTLSAVVYNAVAVALGMAIGLLTRSMAGGVAMTLFLVFVVDSFIAVIKYVRDYSMAHGMEDITEVIEGSGDSTQLAAGVAVTASWLAVLMIAGCTRFTRSDA